MGGIQNKGGLLFGYIAVLLIAIGNITNHTIGIEIIALCSISIALALKVFDGSKVYISWGQYALLVLTIVFGIIFWKFASPTPTYHGVSTCMPISWWKEITFAISLSVLVGIVFNDAREAIVATGLFCAVPTIMNSWAVIYSLISGTTITETTYSPFLGVKIANAGLSNQLLYLPAFCFFYVCCFKLRQNKTEIILLSLLYIFISSECFILQRRVVFVVLYFFVPSAWVAVQIIKKNIRIKEALTTAFLLMLLAFGFILIASQMGRPINIFNDPRFHFQWSFFQQLIDHPLKNAVLDLCYQKKYEVWWFHNFFADVHRSSGFIPFVLAVILVGFIGTRIAYYVFYRGGNMLFLFMFLFVFLILNSSVVPEGEFQPLLLVLMLGSLNEALLAQCGRLLSDQRTSA